MFQYYSGKSLLMALFVLLTFVFYGCSQEKERDNFQEKSKITEEVPSSPSEGNSGGITSEMAAKILGGATDNFSETFKEGEKVANSENPKEAPASDGTDLDVDQEVQNKFLRERKLTLLPQVETGTTEPATGKATKYTLAYKFVPNTAMRWSVTHEVVKKVLYSAQSRDVHTLSKSLRCWNIRQPAALPGKFVCEHTIEQMELAQQNDQKDPVSYNSRTDKVIPREFAIFGIDKTVGRVLERFVIDRQGMLTEKTKLVREYRGLEKDSKVLVPFPDVPIAVGDSWTIPMLIFLKGRDQTIRTYQATEKFTLDAIEGDLAVIRFRTIFLSVATDPVILGQLAEKLFTGTAKFDRKRGMTLETEIIYNDSVTNAMGDSSHLEYRCRVVEKLLSCDPITETKPLNSKETKSKDSEKPKAN